MHRVRFWKVWWCVLTRPGIMTWSGRLRTSSAVLYSLGNSDVGPTHWISVPLT